MEQSNLVATWTRRSGLAGRFGRRAVLGATSAGAAVALAACGTARKPAAGSTGAQAGKPVAGGTFSSLVTSDPNDWDLSRGGYSNPNRPGPSLAYNSVLGFKYGPGVGFNDLVVRPELAEKWEQPDGQTDIFHLRSGLKFANLPPANGRSLTSADVKWSYQYSARTGQFQGNAKLGPGNTSWMFEGMGDIQTPDDATAIVRFSKPFAPFLNYSASRDNPVLLHEIFDQDGNFSSRILGSGPFQLDPTASQHGTRWVWKKNPAYWETGKPYLDQVNWLVLPDSASSFAAFQASQLDWLTTTFFQDSQTVSKANPKAVSSTGIRGHRYLYLNVAKPPLDDARVRRALGLAMDRDALIKVMTGGQGGWALAGAMPDTFTQAEVKQIIKYDPAQAKQLIEQAGYADGLNVQADYDTADATQTALWQLYQAQLKPAGINLTLNRIDSATQGARRKQNLFMLATVPKVSEVDVDDLLYASFQSASAANYGKVNDPKLDSMLVAQRVEADAAKRKQVVRDACQYIYDQAYAYSFYWEVQNDFWQPYIKGFATNSAAEDAVITDAWLEK